MAFHSANKGKVEILTDKTLLEFNIKISDLPNGSHRKVWVKCLNCKEELLREFRHLSHHHMCPAHITRADGTHLKWCNGCKQFLTIQSFTTNNTRHDGVTALCKVCYLERPVRQKYAKKLLEKRKTLDGWLKHAVSRLKSHAKSRGMEYSINYEYAKKQWDDQGGVCYYSGIPLEFGTGSLKSASFERLDSTKGYISGNVVFASLALNHAKHSSTQDDFDSFLAAFRSTHNVRMEFKKLHPDGKLPFRTRTTDAGHDIASIEDVIIPPHTTLNLHTGISIAPPDGFYYTVEGRSSLWSKGIVPCRGIIDGGYTGEVLVAISNISNEPYQVHKGDRIAQIIIHKIIDVDFVEVNEFGPEYNFRSNNGFGSTGR